MKIVSRYDNTITLFESDTCNTLLELVNTAVKEKTYLQGAYLQGADLRGAYLQGADLQGADLQGADLQGAALRGADLRGADLQDVKNMPQISILPEGTLIGWKKLKNNVICKLQIPEDARRINSTGRKCRCEFALVLELFNTEEKVGIGSYDGKTEYKVGEIVRHDEYDDDFRVERSNGIHFFITRIEAEQY